MVLKAEPKVGILANANSRRRRAKDNMCDEILIV